MPASSTDGKDEGKDVRKVTKDEAAFILGAGGKTKTKLSNVSGTTIDLTELRGNEKHMSQIEIRGGAKERKCAMKYINYVIAQRLGPVNIDASLHPDDLTILEVPGETVSLITGAKGSYLRSVEDEWWTLLFFLSVNPKNPIVHTNPNHVEKLAIFGPERNRRGAELKVMAAIENKISGYFTKNAIPRESPKEGFDTDTMLIAVDDFSYALGKNGNTRRKLARASNCIVEYIGRLAHFSGLKKERARAKEYLQWLLLQRIGENANVDHRGREDVTVIMIQRSCVGYVTGTRGSSLRSIEEETNTFCFIEGKVSDNEEAQKPLLIFGRAEDRRFAESLVWERLSAKFDEKESDRDSGRKGKGRGAKGESSKGKKNGKGEKGHAEQIERPVGPDISSDYQPISGMDAAFIMGSGGKTKAKISGASGAFLLLQKNSLEICGTKEERARASEYVNIIIKQRSGPVKMEDIENSADLTMMDVPAEAVSFVTGKNGAFLRMVEEEFRTLLFFINYNKVKRRDQSERLAILGPERERRGAQLKIMATVEMKLVGHFTSKDGHMTRADPREGFATDRLLIQEEDYSYALGKGGSTRKKIARASGCIIEYVGSYAYMAGNLKERRCAREYLGWLFCQRVGPVEVKYAGRDDVTVLLVPKDCVGFVTGNKGVHLRQIEEETGTFCFIEGGRDDPYRDPKPLLIFGQPDARTSAECRLRERVELKVQTGWVDEDKVDDVETGNGERNGNYREKGNGKEKGVGKGERPTSSSGMASVESATAHHVSAPAEIDDSSSSSDGEAWGDWGGDSDTEQKESLQKTLKAEVAATAIVGSNGSAHVEMQVEKASNGMAKWSEQPVPQQFKAERAKGDQELELPPQLVHEEAWPELGGGGLRSAPKKGKKR